jgi:poly(3-hydroxybutyrate) depolymerase
MSLSAPSSCPPTIGAPVLTEAWTEAWRAGIDGIARCVVAAAGGRLHPLHHQRWWSEMAARGSPGWTSQHEIVFEAPIARLLDFSPPAPARVLPTLVLPPQAGHDSCIVDYSPAQSQMGAIIASGLERAFSLDWIGATRQTADASIDDYLGVVDRAVEHCGGRVNLIGDCQGGWLATIYAALEPERVNTLTIAGAPIDFHCGEPIIHELIRNLAPDGNLWFYEALVAAVAF